jgi:hypothetical protein
VKTSKVPGGLRPAGVKVVGHDVDPVQVDVELVHLGVLEISAVGRGDGERVAVGPARLRSSLSASSCCLIVFNISVKFSLSSGDT